MPPKLTSKNIFDVVFEQLPADAFIDTGPATLREELMLEAAGLSSSGGDFNNTNSGSSGRGGSSGFRRHLLPAASIAAAAGDSGGSRAGEGASGRAGASTARAGVTPATSRPTGVAVEDDVLGDAEGVEGGEASDAAPPPPTYAASSGSAGSGKSAAAAPSLFRRVDDGDLVSGFAVGAASTRHDSLAHADKQARGADTGKRNHDEKGNSDEQDREETKAEEGSAGAMNFSMQMDEDDEAVREATKYAKALAAAQAEANGTAGGSGQAEKMMEALNEEAGSGVDGSSYPLYGASASAGATASSTASTEGHTAPTMATAGTHVTGDGHLSSPAHGTATSPAPDGNASATAAAALAMTTTSNVLGPSAGGSSHGALASSFHQNNNNGNVNFMNVPRGGTLSAAEQLALMPPGLDRIYTGSCVMYRHPKGFGFISPDLGGPDVYFINDGVTLSFTRLALRAFYLRHDLPVPASVAAYYHPPKAQPQVASREEKEEDEASAVKTEKTDSSDNVEHPSASPETTEGLPVNEEVEGPLSASAVLNASNAATVAATAPADASAETAHHDTATAPGEEGVLGSSAAFQAENALTYGTTPLSSNNFANIDPSNMSGGAATAVVDVGDRVAIPSTTAAELEQAERAASLLSPATAALLQHQVDQGFGGGLRVGEKMSFVVTRNHAGRGGNGRLLRAEFIRGVPAAHYAMPVEQSWFSPLFPDAIGRKLHGHGGYNNSNSSSNFTSVTPPVDSTSSALPGSAGATSTTAAATTLAGGVEGGDGGAVAPATLVRYTGCVRTYDPEDQRGYLRCDESDGSHANNNNNNNGTPDVVFHAHAVLWDLGRCPPMKRQVKESMRVAYSVCGTERNGKYIATLITTPEGEPFCEENMTFAENVLPFYMTESGGHGGGGHHNSSSNNNNNNNNSNRRRGRGEDNGGVGGNGGGGGRAMGSGAESGMGNGGDGNGGGDRKRAKAAEDDLLLFEEDDYPFM